MAEVQFHSWLKPNGNIRRSHAVIGEGGHLMPPDVPSQGSRMNGSLLEVRERKSKYQYGTGSQWFGEVETPR